jgi:transcriptional regulator CtsR
MKIITLTTENLKNIINQVINESLFTRRRGKYIESYLEDVLESIDPLDYEDEFKYVVMKKILTLTLKNTINCLMK